MNGLRGIGKGAAAKLPSRHPILRLQNQVGGFAHLLTRELVADGVYWRGVERLVQGKRVVGTSDRRHIPALMLPVFKRMIETPFDLLVSIPRAGDPLAYALYRMAEYSEIMGV